MEAISKEIVYTSRSSIFKIYPLGDIHCGVKHCDEVAIREQIKIIKDDKFALWVGMCDYADAIVPSDSRWDANVISDWVERSNIAESQRKWLLHLFSPIKDKCLGLLTGNHEETIRLRNFQDIQLDLCRDLGVPYLGYSCFIRLCFESRFKGGVGKRGTSTEVICHFEHGAGGAQTDGGKMNRLKQGMYSFEGDIYGMAHLHDLKTDKMVYLFCNRSNKIKERLKVGAITGSWFRAYKQGVAPSYAERKGYRPTPVGTVCFLIKPYARIVDVRTATLL